MAGGEERGKRRKPMFATGEVVGDYEPLYLYWREAGERAEQSIIQSRDFEELRRLIEEEHVTRLDEVLERLTGYFLPRVDREAARRALERYYGVSVSGEDAARRIASILAGWLVEAAGELGMLRLRRSWERR